MSVSDARSMTTTTTSTTAEQTREDLSDTLMLEELFDEDTTEQACNQASEEKLKQSQHNNNSATLLTEYTGPNTKQPQKTLNTTENKSNHQSGQNVSHGQHIKKLQDKHNVKTTKNIVVLFKWLFL